MPQKSLIVITVDEHPELNLDEIAHASDVPPEFIKELVDYGILDPRGYSSETWRFDAMHLRRIKTTLHLQQDLEVNLAGAALVLELIDEMEKMRRRIELFDKYFL